ncbi:MAG: amidohydrolase family protein [Chloroflexota bacterium]
MAPRDALMMLIEGGLLIAMDRRRSIARADIAVDGDSIVAVEPSLRRRYPEAERLDASRRVVTPGLVDAHVHLSEHIIRGLVPDDAPEDEWLPRWLLPVYAGLTEEEEHLSALLAFVEMIRTGTTTFCEAGTARHPRAVAAAMEQVGIRGILGQWTWDLPPRPEALRRDTDNALVQLEELLVSGLPAWPIVLGMGTASEGLLTGAHMLAVKHDRGFGMMHRASPGEASPSLRRLLEIGVLDARTKLTHEVYLEEGDVDLLAASGSSVVHCPTAGLRHVKGLHRYGRFPEMLAAGVNVAVGGDSANGSNHIDLTRVMWLCANLYKDFRMDVNAIPAETALEMATLNGARALRLDHEIGSIEPGKRADLVLWDIDQPEWQPLLNPVNNLVHAASGASVHTVIVGGRVVLHAGRIPGIDPAGLAAHVQERAERLLRRLGLSVPVKWPLA